ncbi:MAG: yidD [Verrucomicrobiales bacterium]|nr:yidD [Verrucomicrobiales bacterium]
MVSPVFTAIFGASGLGCRFTPTCSAYALEALQTHGAFKGSCLAAHRLCRCHPWGGSGFDPVPPMTDGTQTAGAHH